MTTKIRKTDVNSGRPGEKLFKIKENLLMRNLKLFFLLPALALMACSKDSDEELETIDTTAEVVQTDDLTELANPEISGNVTEVYYAGNKIPVEEFNGDYIYQGDILIPKNMVTYEPVKLVFEKGETPPAQKSVGRTSARWPNNTVYYAIDGNLSDQQRVHDAIKHWESKTNLKFVKRSSESNYIYFVSGSGCSSYIGMIGGKQNITLSTSCSTGNTIHEIGHAIGLWHEQSRVDRETYITINYGNIKSGTEHNFYTYEYQGFDGKEYTSTLDFGSIMMYGSYSFSSNGQPTIVKKDGSTFNIQRSGLSSGDVTGVNNMYPYSSGGTTETEEIYTNGQYYTIEGLTVLRYNDRWFYKGKWGILEVILVDGTWYYK
jgi:hypothetical protein